MFLIHSIMLLFFFAAVALVSSCDHEHVLDLVCFFVFFLGSVGRSYAECAVHGCPRGKSGAWSAKSYTELPRAEFSRIKLPPDLRLKDFTKTSKIADSACPATPRSSPTPSPRHYFRYLRLSTRPSVHQLLRPTRMPLLVALLGFAFFKLLVMPANSPHQMTDITRMSVMSPSRWHLALIGPPRSR